MNKVLSNTANQIITRKEDEIARLKAENKRLQYTASLNLTYAKASVTRYRYDLAQIVVTHLNARLCELDGLTDKGYEDLYNLFDNYFDIPVFEIDSEPYCPKIYACGATDRKLITKCYTDEEAFAYIEEHDGKIQLKGEDELRALMLE
jgi:hypothetical protein